MKSQKKLIYGVGVNNADYVVQPVVDGKQLCCPYYKSWIEMLRRCYSSKFQDKQPAYVGCSVAKEWLVFTKYRKWMMAQDWKGKQLDKDIICPGNKVYSADTCAFVTKDINVLLTDSAATRGEFPKGVHLHKPAGEFLAQISLNGKRTYLGLFATPEQASIAYCVAKRLYIIAIALCQPDPVIRRSLIRHARLVFDDNSRLAQYRMKRN